MFDASIVIPSYNNRIPLELTLLGFTHQSAPPSTFEVVVVDDGSSDGTRALVEALSARSRISIRYLFQENRGRAAARNAGIHAAQGNVVIFNDADSIPSPAFVEQHLLAHASDERRIVIGAKYDTLARWSRALPDYLLEELERKSGSVASIARKIIEARDRGEVTFVEPSDLENGLAVLRDYALRTAAHNYDEIHRQYTPEFRGFEFSWTMFVGQNVSVRRDFVERAGMFDQAFSGWGYEDTELGYRLQQLGARFLYSDDAANFHQVHAGAMTLVSYWRQLARNYTLFCAKHPTLDVFLHWRYVAGLLSARECNDILVSFRTSALPPHFRDNYLWSSREQARWFSKLDDPRPEAVRARILERDFIARPAIASSPRAPLKAAEEAITTPLT